MNMNRGTHLRSASSKHLNTSIPRMSTYRKTTVKKGELKVQQCREEQLVAKSQDATLVQHWGILQEHGIMECDNGLKLERLMAEISGDSNAVAMTEQQVKQARDELVDQLILDAKYAHLKGVLIEKGILLDSKDEINDRTIGEMGDYLSSHAKRPMKRVKEEYVQQQSLTINQSSLKELIMEKGLIESWIKESRCGLPTHHRFNCPPDLATIINEINEFTASLDDNPGPIDWNQFRSNLMKIHQSYTCSQEFSEEDYSLEIQSEQVKELLADTDLKEQDIDKLLQPMNRLIDHSNSLSANIEGIEQKICRLDLKARLFYSKYHRTLLNREKAYKDMMALQAMRDRIGQRLALLENEIHSSRARLLHK